MFIAKLNPVSNKVCPCDLGVVCADGANAAILPSTIEQIVALRGRGDGDDLGHSYHLTPSFFTFN